MKIIAHRLGLIFAAMLLVLSGSVWAETMQLDWDAAWELALERNESLALAKDEVDIAEHRVGEAWGSALPSVNVTGAYQHYFKIPQTIFTLPAEMNIDPNTGESMGPLRIKTQFGSENNMFADLQVNQPLYVGGKVGIGLEIAKRYRELVKLGVHLSRQELKVSLTQAYYGAILADQFVEVSQDALTQAKRHLDHTEGMYQQGVISEYDKIRAEVAVANLKPQVHQAEAARELAYKGLKYVLGLQVEDDIELTGNLDVSIDPLSDYTTASTLAIEKRIEFQQLELQKQLYKGQYKIENHSWLWPNLFLNLKYETAAQKNDFELSKYEFLGGFGGSLALQVPLFDGFKSHHRAQQARVNMRKVDRQKSMLERGVKIEVFQAISDFEISNKQLQASQEAMAQAEKGERIASVRYTEGVGTQLEVLDAQLQLNTSKVNLLQAKYKQVVAAAAYERAVGGIEMIER
ncbi:TolC family protein [bacterium]|nr:TolC family protein [bacterium]